MGVSRIKGGAKKDPEKGPPDRLRARHRAVSPGRPAPPGSTSIKTLATVG